MASYTQIWIFFISNIKEDVSSPSEEATEMSTSMLSSMVSNSSIELCSPERAALPGECAPFPQISPIPPAPHDPDLVLYVPDMEEIRISPVVARKGYLNVLEHKTHGWKKRWVVSLMFIKISETKWENYKPSIVRKIFSRKNLRFLAWMQIGNDVQRQFFFYNEWAFSSLFLDSELYSIKLGNWKKWCKFAYGMQIIFYSFKSISSSSKWSSSDRMHFCLSGVCVKIFFDWVFISSIIWKLRPCIGLLSRLNNQKSEGNKVIVQGGWVIQVEVLVMMGNKICFKIVFARWLMVNRFSSTKSSIFWTGLSSVNAYSRLIYCVQRVIDWPIQEF